MNTPSITLDQALDQDCRFKYRIPRESIKGMRKLTPITVTSAASTTPALASGTQSSANILPKGEFDAVNQLRLHLSCALQTSLDSQKILSIFATHTQALFGICGVAYTAADPLLNARIGETALHHCNYNLSTASDNIGELCLYSRKRFSDTDLMLMEVAASCTVYPLSNALQYHNALVKAHRDPLTSLGNRLAMNAAIRREASRANRHNSPLSILMIDIDHFKSINDTYGHAAGDRVIACVAEVLKNTSREADNAFRYGGEEFVVLLDGTDSTGAHIAAERIRQTVAKIQPDNLNLHNKITVSVGCATMKENESIATLTERADSAMYLAKSGGRNCVRAA